MSKRLLHGVKVTRRATIMAFLAVSTNVYPVADGSAHTPMSIPNDLVSLRKDPCQIPFYEWFHYISEMLHKKLKYIHVHLQDE